MMETPDYLPPEPAPETPPDEPAHTWSDDDAAQMSLGGCLSFIFLSLFWLAFYVQTQGTPEVFTNLSESNAELPGLLLIGLLAASAIAFVGTTYFLGIRKHPQGWRAVGLHPTSRTWVLSSVVIGALYVPINIMIVISTQRVLGLPALELEDAGFGAGFPVLELAALFVIAAIIVPLAEEMFFRGMLYQWLCTRAGLLWAVAISSLVFGTLHSYIPSIASITGLGVVCALVYEQSKSLWPAVIVHGTNNAIAIFLSVAFSTQLTV